MCLPENVSVVDGAVAAAAAAAGVVVVAVSTKFACKQKKKKDLLEKCLLIYSIHCGHIHVCGG